MLGQPLELWVTGAGAHASGAMLFGVEAPAPVALSGGCSLQLLLTSFVAVPVATDAAGAWSAAATVPLIPSWSGLEIATQDFLCASTGCGAYGIGLYLTNGVRLTFGLQ